MYINTNFVGGEMRKHSFIKGTAILIGANAVSKLLGAVFKIPLTYILHEEGMAIFNTALEVYIMVLGFVISGLPLALSRFTAEQFALGNYKNVKSGVGISTAVLCIVGVLGSVILYFFAEFFAYSMKDPKATFAIKMIAPSIFFVALGTVYKSFYQGCANMIPTAISQVIEAIIKLFIGFFAAFKLKNAIIEYTSAGAVLGITVGEIVATAVLLFLFIPENKKIKNLGEVKRKKEILTSLFSVAAPMLFCSAISASLNLLDTATIRNSLLNITFDEQSARQFLLKYSSYTNCFDNLEENLKLSIDGARWLYGAYTGYALTIFHLPTGIIASLGASIFPIITGAIARGDKKLLEESTQISLKLTMLIVLPCAVVLFLYSEQLLKLLFKTASASFLLKTLSPCLVFICVAQLFTSILHASGRIIEPFIYSLIGILIKLIFNLVLIKNPYFNISAAPIGACVSFFVIMLLNVLSVKKHLKVKINFKDSLIKPTISAVVMMVVMNLIYSPLEFLYKGEWLALFTTFFVGGISYILVLVSLNTVTKKEFQNIHL